MNGRFICEYDREKVNKKLMNSMKKEGIREGMREGEIRGEIKGRQEGIIERNIEIAKNLLKEKIDYNIISRTTGLSINQINSLK